ncbi:MAG: Asp-tRNA(Asn)/Glu-tRNA(Gln) amidotransferase subunit GatA [Candidatus Pacebacteria bacterium]|jgi:aspartyl-tRNA(Asn)/glutamyl-tRNA(Gln) amidotransferase subunit A|nr:Asp-tRNA(Asn)/Glu-tRNA(Gln) amidotransferase subunit GatA [Candidatus Paceibacterota bacterium]
MIDLATLTIEKAHASMQAGEFTARELVEAYLARIKEKNDTINAYLEVYDDVLSQADAADQRFKDGTATLLTGIPIALKDNILVSGKRVSCASKILDGYVGTYTATVVTKLLSEGAVLLGRTNMDEFAMGSSTETSAFGVTKNPHDLSRVAGGSSGGAVAAVAMGGALAALGSDTGGSVRQPASFCGVVGMKPTYGAISRSGLIAMGSSLDQIGPITKTVRDAEILFSALSFHDPMDSTSLPDDMRTVAHTETRKIGVPRDIMSGEGMDAAVFANFKLSLAKLEKAGYVVVPVDLPLMQYSLAVYYVLMPAETSTNLARFDGIRFGYSVPGKTPDEAFAKTRGQGFGKEVRRRIMLGAYVLSHGYYDAYYNKAIAVRRMIEKEFATVFETVDAIATPTSPFPAFKIGEKASDPLAMYLSDIFTVPANIAGIPAISIPAGKTNDGLPLDFQLMTAHACEHTLFKIASLFESLT